MLLIRIIKLIFTSFFFLFLFSSTCISKELVPHTLREVGVSENIGKQIPLDLFFYDENNNLVPLSDFFNKDKSIILNLAYYSCPMLCHLVANGLHDSLKQLPFNIGTKYDVISLSIDPKDTLENALSFEDKYAAGLAGDNPKSFWHFLRGTDSTISELTDMVGFNYRYNKDTKQFAHSAVIIFLDDQGIIKRYLYGIEYKALDVRLGILETLNNNLISGVERVLLFCYNYDPQDKKYVIYAYSLMRIAGVLTCIFLVTMIIYLLKKEEKGEEIK